MPRRRRQRNRTDARKRMLCITIAILPLAAAIAALVALLVTRKDPALLEGIGDDAAVLEAQTTPLPSVLDENETEPPTLLVFKTANAPSLSPSVSDASPPPSLPAAASQFSLPSSNDTNEIASSSSSTLPISASTSNAPSISVLPSSVPSSRRPSGGVSKKSATPSANNNDLPDRQPPAPWEQGKFLTSLSRLCRTKPPRLTSST